MDEPILLVSLLFLCGYLLASLNFSLALHRLGRIPDPRGAHSGNPGVSNVYRTAGPAWAALVLVMDVTRAAGLALVALAYLPLAWVPVAGVGLIVGNRWPIFHGFRGGKAVANYLGFTVALTPLGALTGAGVWVAVYSLSRRTFVASMAMVLTLGSATVIHTGRAIPALVSTGVIVGMIAAAHRPNLAAWRAERGQSSEN